MDMEARVEQRAKEPCPIEVKKFGRLIDVIPLNNGGGGGVDQRGRKIYVIKKAIHYSNLTSSIL